MPLPFPKLPTLRRPVQSIPELLAGTECEDFETRLLPAYLPRCRWFAGKARPVRLVRLVDQAVPGDGSLALCIVRVEYDSGPDEHYSLPLAIEGRSEQNEDAVDSRYRIATIPGGSDRFVCEATAMASFQRAFFELFLSPRRETERGAILASADREDERWSETPSSQRLLGAEQSNSSILYGNRLLVKLLRRLRAGTNPEVELGRALARASFPHTARLLGDLEYRDGSGFQASLAVAHSFARNEGDAWGRILMEVREFYNRAARLEPGVEADSPLPGPVSELTAPGDLERRLIGRPLEEGALLGKRTAQLHRALAGDREFPALAPVTADPAYMMRLAEEIGASLAATRSGLESDCSALSPRINSRVVDLLRNWDRLQAPLRKLKDSRPAVERIRIHGDYHLGQVLVQDSDFLIIDFEGEPLRTIEERQEKKMALADVAGMLRSFHYAACAGLLQQASLESPNDLMPLARFWSCRVSSEYLRAYLDESAGEPFVPARPDETDLLLRCLLIDKALYELKYELNNRPTWTEIPIEGLAALTA